MRIDAVKRYMQRLGYEDMREVAVWDQYEWLLERWDTWHSVWCNVDYNEPISLAQATQDIVDCVAWIDEDAPYNEAEEAAMYQRARAEQEAERARLAG